MCQHSGLTGMDEDAAVLMQFSYQNKHGPRLENMYTREILTKYTAPKLPCPISRKSEKSFSGSSLKKSSAISGSFRLPARALLGIMGSWGAMPLPPATISVCDSDLKAPTDGSSAGQWSHMCSALKNTRRNKYKYNG